MYFPAHFINRALNIVVICELPRRLISLDIPTKRDGEDSAPENSTILRQSPHVFTPEDQGLDPSADLS